MQYVSELLTWFTGTTRTNGLPAPLSDWGYELLRFPYQAVEQEFVWFGKVIEAAVWPADMGERRSLGACELRSEKPKTSIINQQVIKLHSSAVWTTKRQSSVSSVLCLLFSKKCTFRFKKMYFSFWRLYFCHPLILSLREILQTTLFYFAGQTPRYSAFLLTYNSKGVSSI